MRSPDMLTEGIDQLVATLEKQELEVSVGLELRAFQDGSQKDQDINDPDGLLFMTARIRYSTHCAEYVPQVS